MDGIIINSATESEIPTILALREKLFKEIGILNFFYNNKSTNKLWDFYQKEYELDRMKHYLVYDSNNNPVAVTGSLIQNNIPYFAGETGYTGWIIDGYIAPEYRHIGLETKLLELNQQWLNDKDIHEIEIMTFNKEIFQYTRKLKLNLAVC